MDVDVAGAINGLIELFVAAESGFETVGFNTGVSVLGFVGFVVGTVVIGVVISFCTVGIDSEASWYETLPCSPVPALFVAIDVETEKSNRLLIWMKIRQLAFLLPMLSKFLSSSSSSISSLCGSAIRFCFEQEDKLSYFRDKHGP